MSTFEIAVHDFTIRLAPGRLTIKLTRQFIVLYPKQKILSLLVSSIVERFSSLSPPPFRSDRFAVDYSIFKERRFPMRDDDEPTASWEKDCGIAKNSRKKSTIQQRAKGWKWEKLIIFFCCIPSFRGVKGLCYVLSVCFVLVHSTPNNFPLGSSTPVVSHRSWYSLILF